MLEKQQKRYRRHKRLRAKISGTARRPRLCIFRSSKYIYAQLIDDENGRTILSASDRELNQRIKKAKGKTVNKKLEAGKEKISRTRKVAAAYEVGKLVAKKSLGKKIENVVFDKGGYKYHGRVKALADGAREGGLKF